MKTSTWIITILVVVVALYGVYLLASKTEPDVQNGDNISSLVLPRPVGENEHFKGAGLTARAVIVEYSDFQCPACKNFSNIFDDLIMEYKGNLTLVYRHYPLKSIHRLAVTAARASEAAAKQGKFWEMHDALFAGQSEWEGLSLQDAQDKFVDYATELDLNTDQFSKDIDSSEIKDIVENSFDEAREAKMNATPTLYLNGNKIIVTSLDELRQQITDAISGNEPANSPATGTTSNEPIPPQN